MTCTTLASFGIPAAQFRPAYPLPADEEGRPRCIVISRCRSWDEVKEMLEQNKKTHPGDKIWIGSEDGLIVVGREEL